VERSFLPPERRREYLGVMNGRLERLGLGA